VLLCSGKLGIEVRSTDRGAGSSSGSQAGRAQLSSVAITV
jgi:hypothetical protein